MSSLEIIIVAGCFAIGYAYISSMIGKRGRGAPKNPSTPGGTDGDPWHERAQAHDDRAVPPWHEVLGVAPDASQAEIIAAYRSKMRQYHPDKVSTLGSDIQALAEQRAKEINAAYAQAREIPSGAN